MCRHAAFPPGFKREDAIRILKNFESGNTDGVGYAYVKDNEFVSKRWPIAFKRVLRKEPKFLDHMPYDGWTIVHLRAASHGDVAERNTHPFIKGKWAITHNGVWHDYSLVRTSLAKYVKFEGETDSEVAAQLILDMGPKTFFEEASHAGVYLCLNKENGQLWVVLNSGQLHANSTKSKDGKDIFTFASTFDTDVYPDSYGLQDSWIRMNADGTVKSTKVRRKLRYEYENIDDFVSADSFSPETIEPRENITELRSYYKSRGESKKIIVDSNSDIAQEIEEDLEPVKEEVTREDPNTMDLSGLGHGLSSYYML